MMSFKKHYFLFIIFGIFVLVLVPAETSLAIIIGPGNSCGDTPGTITYRTECVEDGLITIGTCYLICCEPCLFGCCGVCIQCMCEVGKSWYEYKCDSPNCDGNILRRKCKVYHSGACYPGSCWPDRCCVSCTPWEKCEECGSWQKPIREPCSCPRAGLEKPECKCKADCIDRPKNPRYYKNSFYPKNECSAENEGQQMTSTNIYLPVKLDWDDVRGWKDQWQDGGCKYVKDCQSGGERCIEEDGIGGCRKNCRDSCLEKLKNYEYYKNLTLKGWLIPYQFPALHKKCLLDCEGDCQKNNKTGAKGCSETCPYIPDRNICYPASEYVRSYVIRIEGEMRDCEALKKIDELEERIEKETDPQKIERYKREIKEIKKNKLATSTYVAVLNKSEFIPPCSCMFKSNRTYKWYVKACCGPNGENCGPESSWTFTTNAAPEPKLPYDTDWNDKERVENFQKEEIDKLQWCEINDKKTWKGIDDKEYKYSTTTLPEGETYYSPLSYKLLIYYKKEARGDDLCHPLLTTGGKCHELFLRADPASGEYLPPPQFLDKNLEFFSKETPYAWRVAACTDYASLYCTEYSQIWRFSAKFTLEKPRLISPPNDRNTPIGLPVLISWSSPDAKSSIYEISSIGQGTTQVPNISLDYPQLKLDTVYSWKVKPCWDFESKQCEDFWSDTFYFRTTGRPPRSETMKPVGENIPIPVSFEWENVPGAKSYRFKIWGGGLDLEKPVEGTKYSLDYPELKQGTNYSWQVKTCARQNGEVCGSWSEVKTFKTFKLSAPDSSKFPENNRTIFTYEMPEIFSWESVLYARYYKYTINYVLRSEEETAECPTGKIIEKIVSAPSDFVSLNCLGEYEWQVTSCLDENCQEFGEFSQIWRFSLAQPTGGERKEGGLVPCGRNYDDPDTLWNEREPCQIKHIFILIKIIIDFLLWKLAPILLVLLVVTTGVIFFFSIKMEAPTSLAQVKSLWKAAGIGYGLIFFTWTIISFLLTLFGYKVGLFGPWWKIIF